MSGDTASSRRRGVRVLGLGFLILFIVLCVVAFVAWRGLGGTPDHWARQQQRIAALPKAEREQISESFHNRLLTEWSASHDNTEVDIDALFGQRKRIEIPFEDLNVWLAEQGPELLDTLGIRLPRAVRGAMVDSAGDGTLRLSIDYNDGQVEQVVALTFDIQVADDGAVTSRLAGASAGRLPIPPQTAIDLISARSGGDSRLTELMSGRPTGPIDVPIDPSGRGLRDGRLVGLEVTDRAMIVTRETVRREREPR